MSECSESGCHADAVVMTKLGVPVCLEHAWWTDTTDAEVALW